MTGQRVIRWSTARAGELDTVGLPNLYQDWFWLTEPIATPLRRTLGRCVGID